MGLSTWEVTVEIDNPSMNWEGRLSLQEFGLRRKNGHMFWGATFASVQDMLRNPRAYRGTAVILSPLVELSEEVHEMVFPWTN